MSIPTVSACDLFTQKKADSHIVVHPLSELLQEDIYLPKKPHRHTFYQVLYVKKGAGSHHIDFQEIEISSPQLFFLAPGQVHDLRFKNAEIEGFLINFDEYFYNAFLSKINFIDDFNFFNRNGKVSSFDAVKCQKEIDEIFTKIKKAFAEKPHNYLDFLRIYLLELFDNVDGFQEKSEEEKQYTHQQIIIIKFAKQLENHFQEAHYPKYYADRLAITANYLNVVCKNYTGKTAGEIIRERIILEAKRLLINSQLSISEISFQLHLEDNSYFTKFFKQNTGITPFQFRSAVNV